MALRLLVSNRQDNFFSFISLLSVLGISIGVAAMIVVLSVIDGFETELRNRFLAANSHVLIFRFPSGMTEPQKWQNDVESKFSKSITGVSPFIHMESMARYKGAMHQILVRGISPAQRAKVQELAQFVRPEKAFKPLDEEISNPDVLANPDFEPSVVLGVGLLKTLGLKEGDTIELLSPTSEDPFGALSKFKIAGTYDSGLAHYDNKLVLMSIPAAQRLFHMTDLVTGLEVGLKAPWKSKEVAAKMSDEFPYFSVKEWQDYNRNMYDAIELERSVIGLLVAIVALVGGFNILTTLVISVVQRQKAISVLKSLGAKNKQIVNIFIRQGALMGGVGAVGGLILALLVSLAIERYQFVKLPEIYLLAKLPMNYDLKVYFGTALGGFLISLLAGIYPAMVASKMDPSQGFKSLDN
jgi:lipoprotein-releasing system permease protein